MHVHFHVSCLDGVYVEEGNDLRFVPAPAPTQAELLSLLERIVARVPLMRNIPQKPAVRAATGQAKSIQTMTSRLSMRTPESG